MLKEDVLKLFEDNRGKYLSGEDIAQRLNVTRTAVWKAVKALENDGYTVSTATNKGYMLDNENDMLSYAGIRKYLTGEALEYRITVKNQTESTNNDAKLFAQNGEIENTVVIADRQTGGKGRMGRKFFSPSKSGIYLSVLLRPKISAEKSILITTAAAVAVCRAIEELSDNKPQIKWVNDIFIDGKKVCGILTEAALDIETGGLEYAVMGMGINAVMPSGGFPDEIKNIAGSVYNKSFGNCRNKLAAEVLNNFSAIYKDIENEGFVEDYRSRSLIIGKKICFVKNGILRNATVTGIDDMCRLEIENDDKTREILSSGEVTIGSKNIK